MKVLTTGLMVVALGAMVLLSGCGDKSNDNTGSSTPKDEAGDKITYEVELYYADKRYVDSGNKNIRPLMEIDDMTMVSTEKDKYFDLIDKELRQVPSFAKNGITFIDESIKLKSATLERGMVTVDLEGKKLSGSSSSEGFVISQIVQSLRESFDEVKAVKFTIDGKQADTLMGHYDISKPYTEGVYYDGTVFDGGEQDWDQD